MQDKLIDEDPLGHVKLDIYSKSTALNLHVIMSKPDIKCN